MGNNKIIGAKIKSIRESKQLSTQEVSERSGLSIEQIERIEGNIDFPSLAPLIKIARVLGVRLGTFLDDQSELGPVICRKKDSNDTNSIGFSNNDSKARKHMEYHSLSQDKSGRHMEPFLIDVAPSEEGVDFVLSTHEGEEFIYVLKASSKSTMARIPISWKKATASITILSSPTMYMPLPTIRRKSSELSTPLINLQPLWTYNYKIRRSASGWNIGPRRHPTRNIWYIPTATSVSPGRNSTNV